MNACSTCLYGFLACVGLFVSTAMAVGEAAIPAPPSAARPSPTVFVQFYTSIRSSRDATAPLSGLEGGFREAGLNPAWWAQELENVSAAGIDVLNLIGGEVVRSNQYDRFAVMLQVMRQRQAEGKANPKVAMFYDGMGFNAFRNANLDAEAGMAQFYRWLHRFFEFFITEQKARDVLFEYDGAFPVFVYHPEPGCGVICVQDRLVPYVKERFERDFPGSRLYLVFSELYRDGFYSNNRLRLTNADNYFNWGASYTGIASPDSGRAFNITTIGPGFDDRNRTDQRQEGWGVRVRDRRDGALFRQEFARAIRVRDRAPWLLLETWNLFLEGSQIAVTRNYGDTYVRICREMIPRFKQPMTPEELQRRDGFSPNGSVTIIGPEPSADVLLTEDHFICDWLVLGPLPLPESQRSDEAARSAVAADDVAEDPAILHPTLGAAVAGRQWQPYRNPRELVPEVVSLGPMFGQPEYAAAYLAAEVIAPQAMTCHLLIGSDDYVRVFVNGEAVHSFAKEGRAAVADSDRIESVRLRPGGNWIVLKVVNLRGGWGAVARLTTSDGRPLRMQR